jgi:hypothetical protein
MFVGTSTLKAKRMPDALAAPDCQTPETPLLAYGEVRIDSNDVHMNVL